MTLSPGTRGIRGPICNAEDARWIGDVLRWFDSQHPGAVAEWRTPKFWVVVLRHFSEPASGEQKDAADLADLKARRPRDLDSAMDAFLRANDNIPGSDNPWSIDERRRKVERTARSGSYSFHLAEYRIGRVLSANRQLSHLQDLHSRLALENRRTVSLPDDSLLYEAFAAMDGAACPDVRSNRRVPKLGPFEFDDEGDDGGHCMLSGTTFRRLSLVASLVTSERSVRAHG